MSVTGELRKNEINTVTPEYRTPETVQIPVQLVNIFSSGIQLPFEYQSSQFIKLFQSCIQLKCEKASYCFCNKVRTEFLFLFSKFGTTRDFPEW